MNKAGPLTFFKELPRHFQEIGAVLPSSPALAKAMARPVRDAGRPLRILEVGPGTGPVTKEILRFMGGEDSLLVCEINRSLLTTLKLKLGKNRHYLEHRRRVKFFLGPVQDLRKRRMSGKFDVIVSSLPFSNFTPELVGDILELYEGLLAPGGTITFFEYLGLRKIGSLLQSRRERRRMRAVDAVVKEWRHSVSQLGEVRTEVTLLNFPPALTLEAHYDRRIRTLGRRASVVKRPILAPRLVARG